jgi:hypothetical protein
MNGPYELGSHEKLTSPSQSPWEAPRLIRGQTYRVTTAFCDADGDEHQVGEKWFFITSMFSKFDDELSICIRSESNQEWRIPLFWTPDAQQDIIENFTRYVTRDISSED